MSTHSRSGLLRALLGCAGAVLLLGACTSSARSATAPDTVDVPATVEASGEDNASSTTADDSAASTTTTPDSESIGLRPVVPTSPGLLTSSSTTATAPTTGPTPTTGSAQPPVTAENGFPVIAYFVATQRICDAHADEFGNPRPNPERFRNVTVDSQLDDFRTVIIDGLGTRLVIDIRPQPPTVSLENDTEPLPFDLSFGCPANLYIGTAD